MATFRNETFSDQEIVVDGNLYESCGFFDCTLIYQGGEPPDFLRCSFQGGKVQMEGTASRTARYLNVLYAAGLAQPVEGVIKRVQTGMIPQAQRPIPCDAVNTGRHYGRLALYSAVGIIMTIFIGWLLIYGLFRYPDLVVLDDEDTRPLSAELPLELMPRLPDQLADAYDGLNADQTDQLSGYAWVDEDQQIARIPVDDAISILIETSTAGGG